MTDALARDLFGAASPVGRRVRFGAGREASEYEIAGVVSGRRFDTRQRPGHARLLPAARARARSRDADARRQNQIGGCGRGHPPRAAPRQELDPNLPVFNIRTAETQRDRALAQERLATLLFTAFGGLALLLAALGLYGAIACDVARRIPEIAVRIAIGAERRALIRMVMSDSLRLVLIGVALGLPLAYAARGFRPTRCSWPPAMSSSFP